MYLQHHGIIGQKWGIRNGPPYPLRAFKSPQKLSNHMRNFTYTEFDRLMSPDEVGKKMSGSCHDQVMYEFQQLRRMGIKPKGLFVIEADGQNGGDTHSLAYFKDGSDYIWFENAWAGREGIHRYKSVNAIVQDIRKAHLRGEFGDIKSFPKLVIGNFDDHDHKIGEDLGSFVDICLGDNPKVIG